MKTVTALIALLMLGSSAQAELLIPGLPPVKLCRTLEKVGFRTEKSGGIEQVQYVTRQEESGVTFVATTYSPASDPESVKVITAMVQNLEYEESGTDALSRSFLGVVATVPYESSKPEEARAWVMANVGKKAEKIFGVVKFQLFANGRTRILRISMDAMDHPSDGPVIRDPNVKLPAAGALFADVVKEYGKPSTQDADTGWAIWPSFKVKFAAGKAAEVAK